MAKGLGQEVSLFLQILKDAVVKGIMWKSGEKEILRPYPQESVYRSPTCIRGIDYIEYSTIPYISIAFAPIIFQM